MELNRDLIKKELVLLIDDMPVELHLHSKKTSKFLSFLKSVLTIITTDEQKIKDLEMEKTQLERNLSECEVGYEGTLFLDRAKLHDAEQKIKEQQAEIEKLTINMNAFGLTAKNLAEENEKLKAQNETLEIYNKDYKFRNKELQEANEGLAKNCEELEIVGDELRERIANLKKSYADYEETTGLKQVIADTVKRMQELIKECCIEGGIYPAFVARTIDKIAKEILEGKDEV